MYGTVAARARSKGSVPDKIDDAKAKAVPGRHGRHPASARASAVGGTKPPGPHFSARLALIDKRHVEPDRHRLGFRQRQSGRRFHRRRAQSVTAGA